MTLVILVSKSMSLPLLRSHLLRRWDCLSFPTWNRVHCWNCLYGYWSFDSFEKGPFSCIFFFCISKCLFCCIFHEILGFHRMLGFLTFIWICWNEYAGHLVQQLLLLFNSWLNVWMEPLLTYFISVPLNTLMTEVPLK